MRATLANSSIAAVPQPQATRCPLRVAILCDFLEENWPSMDLVGDMLFTNLAEQHREEIIAVRVRPKMPLLMGTKPHAVARVFGRFHHYPRVMRRIRGDFDVFHIVDHSYAHLVHELPPERTVVTCHDLDTFRCLLQPDREPRSFAFRAMARHILTGFRRARYVICNTEATRTAILAHGLVPASRLVVAHNGAHPAFGPGPDNSSDLELSRLLGRPPGQHTEILHVGSTIPRKRIDTLLEVFAAVHKHDPNLRLLRIGGSFTGEQQRIARLLGINDHIDVLPRVDVKLVAAAYRRSTMLLQTSEAEGFGLPVIEAMACGTPVIASDIPPLREVGGSSALYCPVGDVAMFSQFVSQLLAESELNPRAFQQRRTNSLARAAQFTWDANTNETLKVYERIIQQDERSAPCQ